MEQAILKTLTYADIFNYPLTTYEIHKWLIAKKVSLREVEAGLKRLIKKKKIEGGSGFYFLYGNSLLISKRKNRYKQSLGYLRTANLIVFLFKLVPWIKLVGVSGNLSMENSLKSDDIDLFVITSKNRLWISRILLLGLLSLIGKRRKRGDSVRKSAGKVCVNLLLEEDKLEQSNKDIYVAHEILQMRVLWQRKGTYFNYLSDNEWVFKFLPNWITGKGIMINDERLKNKNHKSLIVNHKSHLDYLESLARKFQLRIMQKPQNMERIDDGALYFHPLDCRQDILKKYRKRLSSFS